MQTVQAVEELRQNVGRNITWEAAAKQLGFSTGEALRSQYRREKKSALIGEQRDLLPMVDEDVSVIFHDKKYREAVDWRILAKHATTTQEINDKLNDQQRTAEITIRTKRPIGVVFTGDWHFGDGATNHEAWYNDIERMLSTKHMYVIDMGDDIQNMRSFKTLSGVLGQALTPSQQAAALASLIDEMAENNKILAKVDANHDGEFDERIFGEAIQKYYRTKLNAPVFNNRGLLKLVVGSEVYWIALFHKTRFSSFIRPSHGAYREFQMFAPADIIAGAHDHQPAMEALPMYTTARSSGMGIGGMTYLLKIGTYQDSEFGWKYFHNGGFPLNWVTVLWPNEHRIQVFSEMDAASRFLQTFQ